MEQNQETKQLSYPSTATRRVLIGCAIALVLISLFLLSVRHPNPSWPKWWMLKPLLVVPVAGAFGGLFYHIVDQWFSTRRWAHAIALAFGIIGYIIILWLGTVLGLNGTLWN